MKIFKIGLILMVVFAFVGYFTHTLNFRVLVWIFLLFVVMVLIFWYILPFSVFRRAQTFREPTLTLHWNNQALVIGTRRGESNLSWDRFHKVLETKDFFYLYMTNKSFFLVPVSAFPGREERVAFSEMLQSHFTDYDFK